MHPLIGLVVLICGVCFLITTRYRICNDCSFLWRDADSRGFEVLPRESIGENKERDV